MRSRQEIENARLEYIKLRQELLRRKAGGLQQRLWTKIAALIDDMDVSADGRIKTTVRNTGALQRLNTTFQSFYLTAERTIGTWLAKAVVNLLGLNRLYIRSVDKKFNAKSVEERILASTMRQLGFDMAKNRVIRGSWLAGLLQAQSVKIKAMQRISTALAARQSLKDFRKALRQEFLNTSTGLGLLEKHYNTHTSNFFASIDRQTQLYYAEEAKLEYAIWAGSIIAPTKRSSGSRLFCRQRVNRIYTIKEIKSWEAQDWQGKIANSNILVTMGGHNCTHSLSFISQAMAQRLAKQRNQPINSFNKVSRTKKRK